MKQSAAGPQALVVARTTGVNDPRSGDVHDPLLVFQSLAALMTPEEAGRRAIHVDLRRRIRIKNSDVTAAKKASSTRVQMPLARTLAQASGALLADRLENT